LAAAIFSLRLSQKTVFSFSNALTAAFLFFSLSKSMRVSRYFKQVPFDFCVNHAYIDEEHSRVDLIVRRS